jgi:O-antigen ligase
VGAGILFLLAFTPLAFGTVEPWSIAVFEAVAFTLICIAVGAGRVAIPQRRSARAVAVFFALFIALALLQMLPLPPGLLAVVSPAALAIHRTLGASPAGAARPVSICPGATQRDLLLLLAYAAVFAVVVRHCRTRERILRIARAILLMGVLLSLLAILQKLSWNGRLLWFYPVEESLRSGAGIWGPFVNRNHFAGYLEMAIPLGLALLIRELPDARAARGLPLHRRLGFHLTSSGFAPATGLFLAVLFLSACLLSTFSRGAILGWGASTLLFAGITWSRRSLRRKAAQLLLAAAAFAAVALIPAWDRLADRYQAVGEGKGVERLHLLQDSLGILRDFPLVGTGLGTFEQAYRRYQTRHPQLLFDHAHDDYLETATDTGAAGALLAAAMAGAFFTALVRGWRRRHGTFGTAIGAGGICACAAIAVHSATDFNLHIPANALLFTLIAALSWAAVFRHGGDERGDEEEDVADSAPGEAGTAPRRLVAVVFAVALAALLLPFPVRGFLADYHSRIAERLLDDPATETLDVLPIAQASLPDYGAAAVHLRKAAGLQPLQAPNRKALADIQAAIGTWSETIEGLGEKLPAGALPAEVARAAAVAELREAIRLDPTNADLHLALARVHRSSPRDAARADAELRAAVEAWPGSAPVRHAVATEYLLAGRRGEALEHAAALARLDDSYVLPDGPRKELMIEGRAAYVAMLRDSYLFRALEIAWRASGGHIKAVERIVPANNDAKAVLEAFREWKGIEG